MYNDPVQWTRIRRRVAEGESIRGVSRAEKISRKTVRKMLRSDRPSQYFRPRRLTSVSGYERLIDAMLAEDEAWPQCDRRSIAAIFRSVRDHHGYGGSYDCIRRYCRSMQLRQINFVVRPLGDIGSINSLSIEREPCTYLLDPYVSQRSINITLRLHRDRRSERAAEVKNWIDRLRADRVELPLRGDPDTNDRLLRSIHDPRSRRRNRAIAALAYEQGFPIRQISACLDLSRNTCRRYLRIYREGGVERLFAPMTRGPRKSESEDLKAAVFRILGSGCIDFCCSA